MVRRLRHHPVKGLRGFFDSLKPCLALPIPRHRGREPTCSSPPPLREANVERGRDSIAPSRAAPKGIAHRVARLARSRRGLFRRGSVGVQQPHSGSLQPARDHTEKAI